MKETTQIEDNIGKEYLKLYVICVIIMLVAPIFFMFYGFPYPQHEIIFNGFGYINIYLLGGWIGLVFILIAMYRSYYRVIHRTVMIGFLGCAFIGFNFLFIFYIMMMAYSPNSGIIFINVLTPILLLISLVGFCSINLRLYHSINPPKENRAIDVRSNLKITTLSILYMVLIVISIILFISVFIMIFYYNRLNTSIVLIIVGFILMAISLYSLIRELKIRQAIAFGITGTMFLIILNYAIIYTDMVSYLIRFLTLFLILILNIILLRYRAIEPTPLSERITMIKENNFYNVFKRKDYREDDKSRQETFESPKKKVKSENIVSAYELEKRLTPEELEEQRKTESEMGIEKKEFVCVVHKGAIDGPIYLCPYCHTLYCQKCATALKEKGEMCWSCENEINF